MTKKSHILQSIRNKTTGVDWNETQSLAVKFEVTCSLKKETNLFLLFFQCCQPSGAPLCTLWESEVCLPISGFLPSFLTFGFYIFGVITPVTSSVKLTFINQKYSNFRNSMLRGLQMTDQHAVSTRADDVSCKSWNMSSLFLSPMLSF